MVVALSEGFSSAVVVGAEGSLPPEEDSSCYYLQINSTVNLTASYINLERENKMNYNNKSILTPTILWQTLRVPGISLDTFETSNTTGFTSKCLACEKKNQII